MASKPTVTTIKRFQTRPDWWYTLENCNRGAAIEPESGLAFYCHDERNKAGQFIFSICREDALALRDAILELYPLESSVEGTNHAVLGQPLAQRPISVTERPWEREGWLDERGRCWLRGNVKGEWQLINIMHSGLPRLTYAYDLSLPAAALPSLPDVQPLPSAPNTTPENTHD